MLGSAKVAAIRLFFFFFFFLSHLKSCRAMPYVGLPKLCHYLYNYALAASTCTNNELPSEKTLIGN
ncbi:hypothetical protein BYT27DRAFT_6621288 [Phlegmacium glaucopus]|nr:hypothetical protein BYT27DRAFT_6621288 [Phlegmacium glaucopus]